MQLRKVIPVCIFFVAMFYVAGRWNPLEYYFEAPSPAYYQARVAYEFGSLEARHKIKEAIDQGKITMHDYSAVVFPAYAKTLGDDGANLFPDNEAKKSKDQLRNELIAIVAK